MCALKAKCRFIIISVILVITVISLNYLIYDRFLAGLDGYQASIKHQQEAYIDVDIKAIMSDDQLPPSFHRYCKPSFLPTDFINTNTNITLICNHSYKALTSYFPNEHLLHQYFNSSIGKEIQKMFDSMRFNSTSPSHLIKLPQWGIGSTLKHVSKMIGRHYAEKSVLSTAIYNGNSRILTVDKVGPAFYHH